MICHGCRRDNDPKRRFCGGCGQQLSHACPACKFANDAGDRFCGGCGVTIGDQVPPTRVTPTPVDELAGLFTAPPVAPAVSALPDTSISQTDLDRLFGGRS